MCQHVGKHIWLHNEQQILGSLTWTLVVGRKKSNINQGPSFCYKNGRWQSQPRYCQYQCTYLIWPNSINSFPRYWAEIKFWDQSRHITLLCMREYDAYQYQSRSCQYQCTNKIWLILSNFIKTLSGNEILWWTWWWNDRQPKSNLTPTFLHWGFKNTPWPKTTILVYC